MIACLFQFFVEESNLNELKQQIQESGASGLHVFHVKKTAFQVSNMKDTSTCFDLKIKVKDEDALPDETEPVEPTKVEPKAMFQELLLIFSGVDGALNV